MLPGGDAVSAETWRSAEREMAWERRRHLTGLGARRIPDLGRDERPLRVMNLSGTDSGSKRD